MAETFLSVGFAFDPQLKKKEVCVSRSFPKLEKDPRVDRVVFSYVFGGFFLFCSALVFVIRIMVMKQTFHAVQ